jgi:hypothetical protein
MSLSSGTKLGPYEVVGPLGAEGSPKQESETRDWAIGANWES